MFKSMKRIIKWAGKYKGRLYLGSVFSFFSSLSTAIPTMAAAYALDKAIAAYWAGSTIESSLIWQTLWIIVGSIALNFLLSYLRAVLQESIGYEVAAGQRIHLGDVLKRVPLGYFSKNSVGDILTGVTTELSTLELQGMKMVDIIINGYAKFIAILLCFLFLSPAAAVISVVGVAFSSLALHGISRHSEKTAAITHQAMEDMSGSAIEYIRGLSIVKSFGQEGASIESFRKANTDLKNIHIKVEKGYTPFNCLHLFSLKLASMGIVFICAWQTLNGQMSLAYFLMFVLFSFVIFGSVENINDAAHMLGLIDSAMNKLEALENAEYIDQDGKDITPTSYDITFQDVSFGYDKAIFAAKDYGDVNVTVNDESMGTATAQIGSEEAATKLFGVVEGTEVKLQAQPKTGYVFQSWSATYGSDNTQVDIANSTATQTTFLMPETNHQAVNVVATFAEDPNYLSEACDLEKVALLDANGSPVGEYDQDGTVFTITLPADMDTTNLANMILKLTYSKNAQVFKEGSKTAWDANGQACNMTLGTATKFIVRSQKDLAEGDEGPTQEYTITIQQAAAPGTPTLSNGSATRSSKTAATVKFTTNEAGTYYYKVVNHGAAAPTADEIMKSTTKGTASAGETTFTLSNLTEEARDIYIVVVSAAGGKSTPLKVEIPAYGSDVPDTGAYKISVSTPKGGTITTSRTKANAGDEIIVTVTPDDGYQMVAGSLRYGFADGGAPMDKVITNNRFTMPAGDINITCDWETAATTVNGITAFSINGIAGAVNNTTNTITITMPRGTDVTKLTPVIATNGVKSLTPGSGETVNFTNSVTYTATMEDGSSKTYTVTVYVDKGTLADQFWDKLTDFATQVPWWQYAEKQQSTSKYPKYW